MTRLIFSFSLPPELVKEIDARRGLIKRSTYVEKLLVEGLLMDKEIARREHAKDSSLDK